MSLESAIAEQTSAVTALTQAVNNKMGSIDAKVQQKINELESWRSDHIHEHPALAVNYNASMLRLSGVAPQQVPMSMSLNAGGNFFDKFSLNIIPVITGNDTNSRPPIARELLQYMGCDQQNFSASFNIVEITVKSIANGFGPFVFTIPYRHVKSGAFHSVILYHKLVGQANWGWVNNEIHDKWNQHTTHVFTPGNAGGYTHVDISIANAAVGDKFYLALPQIVLGKWDPSLRAPQFFNIWDMIIDAVPSALPSGQ